MRTESSAEARLARQRAVSAAVALAMFGMIAPQASAAPAAPAATSCSIVTPSRVAINTPYRGISLRLASNCAVAPRTIYASWHAYHPTQGFQTIAIFDNTSSDTWDLYDWEPLGRWQWRPGSAWDSNHNDVPQNTTYTDIKVAPWAGLAATRSGSRVTLTSSAAYYHPAYDRYVPWARSAGQMQWKPPGTTTWRPLRNVYSNASGKYTFSYTVTAVRDYRVYFPATGVIWNVASRTVRK